MSYAEKYAPIVRQLLLERKDLTHQTLIDKGFGWRLSAVIYRLRWNDKWPIITDLDMRRVAHYRLPPGWYPPDKAITPPQDGESRGGSDGS